MTDASVSSYVHANAAFDDELDRLHLLEARYDPCTFRRLSMFGPLAGARCGGCRWMSDSLWAQFGRRR
jgi:hypothetical protein